MKKMKKKTDKIDIYYQKGAKCEEKKEKYPLMVNGLKHCRHHKGNRIVGR